MLEAFTKASRAKQPYPGGNMSKVRSIGLAGICVLAISSLAWAEQVTFKVKHQFRGSPDSTRLWWLVESGRDLGPHEGARTVSIKAKPQALHVPFHALGRGIFEQTPHMTATA